MWGALYFELCCKKIIENRVRGENSMGILRVIAQKCRSGKRKEEKGG